MFYNNNMAYYVVITNLSLIEEVFFLEDPKGDDLRQIAFRYPNKRVILLDREVAVGDKVTSNLRGRVIQRPAPLVETEVKEHYKKEEEKKQSLTLEFISKLEFKNLSLAKEVLKNSREDQEVSYRAFYNSFKMYRVKDDVFNLAQAAITVLTGKPFNQDDIHYYEVYEDAKKLGFDQILLDSLRQLLICDFSLDRNESSKWIEDARLLFSSKILMENAVGYLIGFSESIISKKVFFLNGNILSWDEAGAMEAFTFLSTLRYSQNKFNDKVAELVRTKYA